MMQQIPDNYLLETIQKACSLNAVSVKEAEVKIQELEIQPGYCVKLLVSLSNKTGFFLF